MVLAGAAYEWNYARQMLEIRLAEAEGKGRNELASELFHQKHSQWGMGVHPRLVHTRFGFHIIHIDHTCLLANSIEMRFVEFSRKIDR